MRKAIKAIGLVAAATWLGYQAGRKTAPIEVAVTEAPCCQGACSEPLEPLDIPDFMKAPSCAC